MDSIISVAPKNKSLKRCRGTLPICSNYEEKKSAPKIFSIAQCLGVTLDP